jgi:hypothetical protein
MTATNAEYIHARAVLAGRIGGKSRSPAKLEATRRNAATATAARMAKYAARQGTKDAAGKEGAK